MKITTLLAAFIVVFSLSAFAADNAANVTPAIAKPVQEKKTDEKMADGKKKFHHRNHFRGEVKSIDAKTGTVTISRGEKTFAADESLLSGIKVGDKISVKFTEKGGQLTATGIKPAKAHHRKKEQKNAAEIKTEEKK